ncbi:MAG TPA: HU family DNA-binding protein [Candidatus Aquirickettsiella sp.]|jgi:integration host factor subunit beta|uniref:HU family DNA-binding protein n=1 Tax=Rickettsiella endosymbiont of Xylota segnis TaxID=3066238 RepID=UPI002F4D5F51
MLKPELINQLILRFPQLQAATVKKSVEHLIQLLEQTLYQGRRIEIRGFGSFSPHYNAARSAFNPKTGEHFLAPEKYRIHFKMGKTLKYCVNKPTLQTEINSAD